VFYYTDYRFYQIIMENSWILIWKNRYILNTKHFRIPLFYYLLFNFLGFLTSFILFYLSMVFKKILKFVLFKCMDMRFYQKILQNYCFFFKKKLRYLKSRISTKFHRFQLIFYFFSMFCIFFLLFHLSELVKKLWNFL